MFFEKVGLAIAFAAQKILKQLLSTIVLYLDRPFIPGNYIRISLNPHANDVYGRVEPIGLRSTKLRTSAKSALVIIPNNTLANTEQTRARVTFFILGSNEDSIQLRKRLLELAREKVVRRAQSTALTKLGF